MVTDRPQSFAEEIANSVTHGVGLLLSLAALPLLVLVATAGGDSWRVAAAGIYGASLVLLYTTSTLYHAIPGAGVKAVLRRWDHAAIYLLIAGSYTPFLLGPLRGAWGWSLFGVIWALALVGVLYKAVYGIRMPRLSTALYLAMGWLAVVGAVPFVRHVPSAGLGWLLLGGLFYTGGVVFYVLDSRMRYAHAVWHLFVLAGSAAHFWAVYSYTMARGLA
jgi:hemolysin III